MRILLDQNVPAALCRLLPGHTAIHAFDIGWGTLANGELIAAAERDGFEVLLTADRNIRHQQNLRTHRTALIVLETNRLATLRAAMDRIIETVGAAAPGSFVSIPFDRPPLLRRPPPAVL
jgi:predicted nuclease of predicted toxin-antitoxin system